MPTTLITGANRGLGLEFVRQYAADGCQVIAGCRDPDQAAELQALVARANGAVEPQRLDVADGRSVAELARKLAGRPIDLLVNNAGMGGSGRDTLGQIDYERWQEVLAVNTLGPLRVTEALIDNVAASAQNALRRCRAGWARWDSSRSKAAPGRTGLCLPHQQGGREHGDARPGARGAVARDHRRHPEPGWVRTDMGGPNARLAPEESIAGMRQVIAALTPADAGRFLSYDGTELPW